MSQASVAPNRTPGTTTGPDSHEGSMFLSQRARRQIGIWAAGSAFMIFSGLITRRAIIRRNNWTRPLFFVHNDQAPPIPINGPLEALEALSVATINTLSFGIMLTGGMFWAFDIASVAEWRKRTRAKLGYEKAIAEELGRESVTPEMWVASVLTAEEDADKKASNS